MRIVKNLNEIDECPNCEGHGLIRTTNEFGRPFKQCCVCTEEIYEDEDTYCVVGKARRAPDDIDDSLMNIEYEVGNLPRYATNKDELEYLEHIRNIFDELISVIRRMK